MDIDKLIYKFKNIEKINHTTNSNLNDLIYKLKKPKKSFTPEIFKYDDTSNNYLDNMGELYGLFICMFLIEDYLKRLDQQMNIYEVD